MDSNKLLTVKEAAEFLRLKPRTIYAKVKDGLLPCVRIGKSIRFEHEALKSLGKQDG